MRKTLAAAAVAASLSLALPAQATDVGVSISVSQPGVYGRIDIGRFPQPRVVLAQPVIVQRPVVVHQPVQPVYMWVPPGHRKNWRKHCRDYGACGVPVYFVQDRWYGEHVRPYEQDRQDERRGHGKGDGKGRDRH